MAPPASPSRAGIPLRVVEAVSVSPLPVLAGDGSCPGGSPGVSQASWGGDVAQGQLREHGSWLDACLSAKH